VADGYLDAPLDAFSSVAVTSMVALAITDLHVELLAGAAAWVSA
jgi:hypothetical protein